MSTKANESYKISNVAFGKDILQSECKVLLCSNTHTVVRMLYNACGQALTRAKLQYDALHEKYRSHLHIWTAELKAGWRQLVQLTRIWNSCSVPSVEHCHILQGDNYLRLISHLGAYKVCVCVSLSLVISPFSSGKWLENELNTCRQSSPKSDWLRARGSGLDSQQG
jgi:hypothetical protein